MIRVHHPTDTDRNWWTTQNHRQYTMRSTCWWQPEIKLTSGSWFWIIKSMVDLPTSLLVTTICRTHMHRKDGHYFHWCGKSHQNLTCCVKTIHVTGHITLNYIHHSRITLEINFVEQARYHCTGVSLNLAVKTSLEQFVTGVEVRSQDTFPYLCRIRSSISRFSVLIQCSLSFCRMPSQWWVGSGVNLMYLSGASVSSSSESPKRSSSDLRSRVFLCTEGQLRLEGVEKRWSFET